MKIVWNNFKDIRKDNALIYFSIFIFCNDAQYTYNYEQFILK